MSEKFAGLKICCIFAPLFKTLQLNKEIIFIKFKYWEALQGINISVLKKQPCRVFFFFYKDGKRNTIRFVQGKQQ